MDDETKMIMLRIGSKVCYQPEHYGNKKWENGIVKELRSPNGVWVVYNCDERWHRYMDYTSAKTTLQDLKIGWKS